MHYEEYTPQQEKEIKRAREYLLHQAITPLAKLSLFRNLGLKHKKKGVEFAARKMLRARHQRQKVNNAQRRVRDIAGVVSLIDTNQQQKDLHPALRRLTLCNRQAYSSKINTRISKLRVTLEQRDRGDISCLTKDSEQLKNKFGERFVEQATEMPVITPLTFQKQTKLIIKTKAAKAKEQAANIASKRLRYRRTAQVAEGLTRLLPELIGKFLAARMRKEVMTYKKAKGTISAMY